MRYTYAQNQLLLGGNLINMILLSPINWPCFYWNNKGSLRKIQILIKNKYKPLTLNVFRVQMIIIWCYSTRNHLCHCMKQPQAQIVVAVSILQGAPLCVSDDDLWQVCRTLYNNTNNIVRGVCSPVLGCPLNGTEYYRAGPRVYCADQNVAALEWRLYKWPHCFYINKWRTQTRGDTIIGTSCRFLSFQNGQIWFK